MVNQPIKVAVLEGDYADLCGLGLPLSLSLQLQLQDLKLSALWSAKASASGFSVSLYWPTAPALEKAKVKKSRRKRKRGKAKERAISSASNLQGNVTTSSASVLATLESSRSAVTPITAHSSPTRSPNLKSSVTHDSPCVDLAACSDAQYEVKDGVHGVSYSCSSDQSNWTPVVGRRKKRGPVPDFIQRRFPPGHPLRCSVSPESGSDSASDDLDLDTIIPTGANVDVHFKLIDGTPGLAVRTSSTQSWTPIAARTRTRARLK